MSVFFLKKTGLFIFTILLLASCSHSDEEQITIPATVMDKEKFTKLIVDFALAESVSNLNVKNVAVTKLDSVYAFDPLKENNVSRSEYDSAISFYSRHPLIYKEIYENVLVALSKMQIKKDSIKVDPVSKK